MCGIVGYIGDNKSIDFLFNNLRKLEYRGYDSAGLAYFSRDRLELIKSIGNMEKLKEKLDFKDTFFCGIGHTRWATNGEVNFENTHPHLSKNREWVIVHNGIIENAEELKNKYKIETEGTTDTEIVANLLEKKEGSTINRLKEVCEELRGSWAFLILNIKEKDKIYIAKKKSPLYFSTTDGGKIISSDPTCFGRGEYFSLPDGSFAIIKKNKNVIYDANLQTLIPKKYFITEREEEYNKGKYEYYMLKEIDETPQKIKNIIDRYSEDFLQEKLKKNILKRVNFIKIIGCGSAYHSALLGAYYFRKNLKIEAEAYLASEFKSAQQIVNREDLYIFVTQSGETADTIECLKMVKKYRAKTIVLTNVMESTISKLSRRVLPICAGREIAVASTKAYTCQSLVFFLLAKYFKKIKFREVDFEKEKSKLIHLSESIEKIEREKIKNIDICSEKVFFLGKGRDYITALEGSLKFKEITYINSQCCPIGELKHGSLAVVDNKTQSVVFLSNRKSIKKVLNGVHEIASRKGKVLVVSPFDNLLKQKDGIKTLVLDGKGVSEELTPILTTIFSQYLAYFTCLKRNLNPDQPRNLAKSVTVE